MIHELSNPVITNLISQLRDSKTESLRFRQIIQDLARLLAYESFKLINLEDKKIDTWLGEKSFPFIKEDDLMFIPILRAGLPMLDPVTEMFPNSTSGFLAMARDETTHESVLYYDKVPECTGKVVVLLDPMVATGGSLADAIEFVKKHKPKKIISLNIIGAPEGLAVIEKSHSDIDLFIAQIDEKLNEDKFIIPGLGDAGDRAYNTNE
ncbi:Uracil phosphoribosyltransferase [hydrothermal vent metagenome]|uniref:uracil phosphoribosyltransferase n=1 Tax=hydrothermal vent metagenome TaxID=652676 RepID=A0A1W1EEX0_9ZZZZ